MRNVVSWLGCIGCSFCWFFNGCVMLLGVWVSGCCNKWYGQYGGIQLVILIFWIFESGSRRCIIGVVGVGLLCDIFWGVWFFWEVELQIRVGGEEFWLWQCVLGVSCGVSVGYVFSRWFGFVDIIFGGCYVSGESGEMIFVFLGYMVGGERVGCIFGVVFGG